MRRFALLSALVLVPALSVAQTAPAGDRVSAAQQHIVAAMAAFRAHDYGTAIHEFELSYRAAPNADVWYNLGRARELSGDYEGAVADYQRYLRDRVDAPDRVDVQRNITALESLIEHQAAARRRQAEGSRVRFQLDGLRGGARLYLDERELPASAAGEPVRVAVGEHAVRITADDAQEWSARVRVRDGETATVFASLQPASRYVTQPSPHITSAVLAGLGVVSLGVAGFFAVRASTEDCNGCGDEVRQSNRSDIFLGVGAGLAVGAAIAFFVERASGTTRRITAPAR